jgi:hypothetical protein
MALASQTAFDGVFPKQGPTIQQEDLKKTNKT